MHLYIKAAVVEKSASVGVINFNNEKIAAPLVATFVLLFILRAPLVAEGPMGLPRERTEWPAVVCEAAEANAAAISMA